MKKRDILILIALLGIVIISLKFNIFNYLTKDRKDEIENTTLQVWIMPNTVRSEDDLDDIISLWTKETGIKVEVTVIDWGSAWNRLTTAATSGIGPDICQLGTTWVPTFASMDILEDLTPYLDANTEEQFFPAAWKYSGLSTTGETTTLPWISDIRIAYYRRDVFAAAGIDPDQAFATWEGFESALRMIKEKVPTFNGKKISPFAHPGKNDWNVPFNFSQWIWSAGGQYITEDGMKSTMTDPKTISGIEKYISFVGEGLVDSKYLKQNSQEIQDAFGKGEIGVVFLPPAVQRDIKRQANGEIEGVFDKVEPALPPAGKSGRATFFGGSNLGIFSFSENKKEAVELLKYLTLNSTAAAKYANLSAHYPPLYAAAKDPVFDNNKFSKTIGKAGSYGKAYPVVPWWGLIELTLIRRCGNIWDIVSGVNGEYDINDVIDELERANSDIKVIIKAQE